MKVIEIKNICKQYPGSRKKANNNISLDLNKGEILCIAGENGAGKTTLMKILCGLEKQDTGEIIKKGNICMVHQHFMLFPEYTAAENIVMGIEPRKWGIFFDRKKAVEISENIINKNNFNINAGTKVKELTLGEMQQVEICRVLYQNADIIILDEPTSILTEQEIKSLFITLKSLVKNEKSIILITHKLHEIKQIADRIAVLRRGELKGFFNAAGTDEKDIASLMFGENENYISIYPDKKCYTGKKNSESAADINIKSEKKSPPVIAFKNVTVKRHGQKRPLLDNVSFSVDKDEILGFTGTGGNGLGVIEAVLGGFLHPQSGKILRGEIDISKLSTYDLRKQGLAYVPSDRMKVGSAIQATIEENMTMNIKKLKGKAKSEFCKNLIEEYNIELQNPKEKAFTLSGGNLQKLILAREINNLKDYIVFSEPTWGLDAESGKFIINEIKKISKKGAAVILISTNMDEIISLADRIIVMYRGRIAGDFSEVNMSTKEEIGKCMQGIEYVNMV